MATWSASVHSSAKCFSPSGTGLRRATPIAPTASSPLRMGTTVISPITSAREVFQPALSGALICADARPPVRPVMSMTSTASRSRIAAALMCSRDNGVRSTAAQSASCARIAFDVLTSRTDHRIAERSRGTRP